MTEPVEELTERELKYKIGGQMQQKPVQPLRATCRDRSVLQDPAMVSMNLALSAEEARELLSTAKKLGMETENFVTRILALEYVDPTYVIRATEEEYQSEYPNAQCGYEETGDKRKCWGCPVPGNVLGRCISQTKEQRGREDDR